MGQEPRHEENLLAGTGNLEAVPSLARRTEQDDFYLVQVASTTLLLHAIPALASPRKDTFMSSREFIPLSEHPPHSLSKFILQG